MNRARATIDLFRLNRPGLPEHSLRELERFEVSESSDVDEWSYRFLYG